MLLPGSGDVLMEMEPKGAEPVDNDSGRGNAESETDAANTSTQDSSISNGDDADDKQEMVELKIIWNKNKYDLKIPVDNTGAKLKESIHSLTGRMAGTPTPTGPRWVLFNALYCPSRSSSRHAEGDVQRFTSGGQDVTRHQGHERCQNHGGGIHDKRRAGCEHAQRGHAAGGEGRGEQEGASVQTEGGLRTPPHTRGFCVCECV